MAEQGDTRGIYPVESTAAGLPVTTAQEFPEWQIQRYLGLCFGLVVRQRTGEVFRDPSTDRMMRVWVDPADNTRHYVPEPPSSAS